MLVFNIALFVYLIMNEFKGSSTIFDVIFLPLLTKYQDQIKSKY